MVLMCGIMIVKRGLCPNMQREEVGYGEAWSKVDGAYGCR